MANGFFGRLFGGKKNTTTNKKNRQAASLPTAKSNNVKATRPTAITTNFSSSSNTTTTTTTNNNNNNNANTTTSTTVNTTTTTNNKNNNNNSNINAAPVQSSSSSLPLPPSPSPSPPPTPQKQQNVAIEKKASAHNFFATENTQDRSTETNDFINPQGNKNDINLYIKNMEHTLLHESHEDEYSTISSAISSSRLSLQDALFSHLSDNASAFTEYSEISPSKPASISPTTTTSKILDRPSNKDELYHEKKFCDIYMNALRQLSLRSSDEALKLFAQIADEGQTVYADLSSRAQFLVSYAQYRAGRLLFETDNFEQGLQYLLNASKNGNARATFILGTYAERRGDFEFACHQYYEAACKGSLPAKVSFGNMLLFKHPGALIAGYQLKDAIRMLDEAHRQGHSIASLSLALYYEKEGKIEAAIQYGRRFRVSPSSPIFCVGSYQIGIIHLKAGIEYAEIAFCYMAAAAKAEYYDSPDGKFTPALRTLGILTLLGIGTPKNATAAFKVIQEAAMLGDEPANIILAQLYQRGQGCTVDLSKAMQIFNNYEDNIAAKLSRGLLMMKDNPEHAYREFVQVIRHQSTPFDAEHWHVQEIKYEASVRIALWEYNGIGGTQKNPERAFHTLKKLSDDCDYSGAHYWLAHAYLDGVKLSNGDLLVAPDRDAAFACFLKGANQNQPECQYYAGFMLHEGYSNAAFNKSHALHFFLKAADQNFHQALTQVGAYYFSGSIGTQGRDLDKAFHYFSVAASKYNDPLAIQYLADYMINNTASGPINHYQIYTELNRSAGVDQNPVAYRMLALVVNSGMDPRETYEDRKHPIYPPLAAIYNDAKIEAMMTKSDIKFRFALHCLWRAIELNDHASGQYLCNFYPTMNEEDVTTTIETFEKVETGVPSKLSIAFAQFLKVSKNRSSALTKFIEVANCHPLSTSTSMGWNARLEAAKLILMENEGKARTKVLIFIWLNEMIKFNGKNLFTPFILLAKCHDDQLCFGCNKDLAIPLYENGLQCKSNNAQLEVFARMRLIETYYTTHHPQLKHQLTSVEPILHSLADSPDKQLKLANLYYYKGLLSLHNGTIYNYRNTAREYLSKADQLGHITATLELGYLYGTMESEEEKADACFQKVENSKNTIISFKNRITESMVQMRAEDIHSPHDYMLAIHQMKLAAGITYSYYGMERQALDWLHEISDNPLAQIMILYYNMKEVTQRTSQNIKRLSDLMSPFEATHSLDYYGRMALSYGQLRLGQCYESGHGVEIDNNKVLDYYNKACAYLQNNETYERLAEISDKSGADINLFPTLCNAARNDPGAIFKLARYYHEKQVPYNADVPCKKAADQYLKAAQEGHPEACYYYAKYRIDQTAKTSPLHAATNSKKAALYLKKATQKNHGPSFYELGKLEMAAGLYEEAVEDLKEADFLKYGPASFELGELYRKGFTGVISGKMTYKLAQNPHKAHDYYQRAKKHDSVKAMAMIRIGHFYETGDLDKQDPQEARKWYMRSLQLNEGEAAYALGCLEETLISMGQEDMDRTAAYRWFDAALKAGNKAAHFKVGCYLVHQWSPVSDVERGLQMLKEENSNGNVMAMKELARFYQSKSEYKRAFSYWRNAEMMNDAEALEFIAQCFEKGLLGQAVDPQAAAEYKMRALEARKQAVETQCSMMGFKSDYSEEARIVK